MIILVLILALLWAVAAANEEVALEPKQNNRELLRRRHFGLRGTDEFTELIRLCKDGYYAGTLSLDTMEYCEDLLGYHGLRRVDRYRDVSNQKKKARRRSKKIKKLRKKYKKKKKRKNRLSKLSRKARRKRRKRAIKRARRYRLGRDRSDSRRYRGRDFDNWPLDIDRYDYP